ncbi:MAG: ABC transporter ATP-binding protein [Actinomyces sp.]|nr:MAG: ABC transporter ATP-binding protein [Actinomyces sp.]
MAAPVTGPARVAGGAPGADPVIETVGLTKHYGPTVAVDHLDLTVRRGEIFGLLGPNGAGKTTTILMLLGLTEPTAGHARVLGLDPTRAPLEVKRRVGYLPDDVGFYGELTGRQNLGYTARLNRIPDAEAAARIDDLLEEVGLTDAADRPVEGYSRGMRQRLGLADALVKDPEVLILDEPTVNIDPEGVREILALVQSRRDAGLTVLLSSHLLHQVEQTCDRLGIFLSGRLVACGTVDELTGGGTGEWTIEIATEGAPDRVAEVLGGVAGVRGVERTGRRWIVTATHDVRAAAARALVDAGVDVLEIVHHRSDLDDVYHRWFGGDHDTGADGEVTA